jgi:hypothetical protein
MHRIRAPGHDDATDLPLIEDEDDGDDASEVC